MPKTKTVEKDSSNIPILEDDGSDYKNWKIRVRKWVKITSIPKKHQANELQLRLGQTAFDMTKHIDEEILDSSKGVDALLEALDELYVPDKLQDRMQLFQELRAMRRGDDEPVIAFIQKYMVVFQDFRKLSDTFNYDDTTLAMDLFNACNLKAEDRKLVSASMTEPPNSANVKSILKRVFASKPSNTGKATSSNEDNDVKDIFFGKVCYK